MANFGNIVNWVLRLEDRTLAGKIVNLGDGAGFTRLGITSKNFGSVVPATFFGIMGLDDAIDVAKGVYYDFFWKPLQGVRINSDVVAAELMSFAVNESVETAVALAQRVLGIQPPTGHLGEVTLAAINNQDGDALGAALRDAQDAHYQAIVRAHPLDERFLRGWENRDHAVYPDLPK